MTKKTVAKTKRTIKARSLDLKNNGPIYKNNGPLYLKYDEPNDLWVKMYDKMTKQELVTELKSRDAISERRDKWGLAKNNEFNRKINVLSGVVHVMAAMKGEALPKEAVKVLVSMSIQALDDFLYGYGDDDDDDSPWNDIGQLKDDQPF